MWVKGMQRIVLLIGLLLLAGGGCLTVSAEGLNGWQTENGKDYWYEDGVRQGYDPENSNYRGKEIYDSSQRAWFWLDNAEGGVKAVSKDVYQESDAGQWAENKETGTGKWVRYDKDGHMVKGWDVNEKGIYYFDETYGTMAKGWVVIGFDGYFFNESTGVLEKPPVYFLQGGWYTPPTDKIDSQYWVENGVIQGTDPDNPDYRGKEIYDSSQGAWFWLDAANGGAKTVSKDVYQESDAGQWAENKETGTGKWVRYDKDGHMVKGWDISEKGSYYFDETYGTMAKGRVTIEGEEYVFDEVTGVLIPEVRTEWVRLGEQEFWYEDGVRQGYDPENPDYRGKEIYDPESDAWYWLDNVQYGAKAVNKDVYQESEAGQWAENKETGTGKWVRYDENGHMVKGWDTNEKGTYYFDPIYGTMARGDVVIDGNAYIFDSVTGILFEEIIDEETGEMTIKVKPEDVKYSGKNGGISWTITKEGKLIIAGICGKEQENGWKDAEWLQYTKEIKSACVDIKEATNLSYLFKDLEVDYIDGLQTLDTSKVNNMSHMFEYCDFLSQLDVSHFDTGNVTDMSYMFAGCAYMETLDLSNFDTRNVTDMSYMFYDYYDIYFNHRSNLETIILKGFDTRNVTNMEGMFSGCKADYCDISHFDTGNVTNMSFMFQECYQNMIDVDGFDTSKVTSMKGMFKDSFAKEIDLTNFDTRNVTDMSYMFSDGTHYYYEYPSRLKNIFLGNFDTGNVTNMEGMFRGCCAQSYDVSNFDTAKVINMKGMFEKCEMVTELDISSFDTRNVTDMSYMFAYSKLLTRIIAGQNWVIQSDAEVKNMFENCGTDRVTMKQ